MGIRPFGSEYFQSSIERAAEGSTMTRPGSGPANYVTSTSVAVMGARPAQASGSGGAYSAEGTATCQFYVKLGEKMVRVNLGPEFTCTKAQKALIGVGAELGSVAIAAATGTATTVGTAIGSVLTAAGISASVPVVGAVIAGGALLAVGIDAIVRAARAKGRRAAEEAAEQYNGGRHFAKKYLNFANKNTNKVEAEARRLARQLRMLRANPEQRGNTAKLADEINALQVILYTRVPAEAVAAKQAAGSTARAEAVNFARMPLIAGEADSAPLVADAAIDWTTWGIAGVAGLALIYWSS